MTDELLQAPSLRESLASAVADYSEEETHDTSEPAASEALPPPEAADSDRQRDEAGRFMAKAQGQEPAAPREAAQQEGAQPVLAPAVSAAVAPPSSWRKEHHDSFGKLDPSLQNYILQREREFATGVSVYKAQADQARALQGAMEPFLPELARHNIQPEQWITNLGRAHYSLVNGSPSQKASMFMQLARDYGVDLSQFGVGGEGQQPAPQNAESAWLQKQLADVRNKLQGFEQQQYQAQQNALRQEQAMVEKAIAEFSADTAKYPHFAAVRETMAGLLQSGLAQDLPSAYEKALRHHDDLWQAQQAEQQRAAEAERKREAAAAAAQARAKVSSIRSATPSGEASTTEAQGLRATLQASLAKQQAGRV